MVMAAFVATPIVVCILGGLVHLLFYLVCGTVITLLSIVAVVVGIDITKAAIRWIGRKKMIFC